jgi:MerR family transcriptional regulator, heat shock protein HspR
MTNYDEEGYGSDRDGPVAAGPGPAVGKGPSRRTAPRSQTMAVYVISVAAELAGVHPQTLRIYERKGLLGPARTLGGSRRYSDEDINLLRRIQDLTSGGLNLEGVKRVIELETELGRLRQELAQAQADARAAIDQVHRQYRRDLVPLNMSPVRWFPGRR